MAAPGGLPFQRLTQKFRVNASKNQPRLPRPVLGGAGLNLIPGRKVDEAVAGVLRGATIMAQFAGGLPVGVAANMINQFGQGWRLRKIRSGVG